VPFCDIWARGAVLHVVLLCTTPVKVVKLGGGGGGAMCDPRQGSLTRAQQALASLEHGRGRKWRSPERGRRTFIFDQSIFTYQQHREADNSNEKWRKMIIANTGKARRGGVMAIGHDI